MGLDFSYISGQTPLDEDEKEGLLIKTISTRGELDEFEQLNIQNAVEWVSKKTFKLDEILSEDFIKRLHSQMLGVVWKWAGTFRKSDKNIGVHWTEISVSLRTILDDCKFWILNKTYPEEEIAVRFKHRLVSIHPFPNGNGRHSRLIADILISDGLGKKVFSWGNINLVKPGQARSEYITALKAADNHNIIPLLIFARS
jgi:Fic-DOC domain mobile mystery protein B